LLRPTERRELQVSKEKTSRILGKVRVFAAGNAHTCVYCGREIAKGDRYARFSVLRFAEDESKTFTTIKAHITGECLDRCVADWPNAAAKLLKQ